MFDIFNVQNGRLTITPEILTIKPFRDIYERDPLPNKSNAIKELLYVYHCSSYKSGGVKKGLENSTLHNWAVTNSEVGNNFKVDDLIRSAIKEYKYHQNSPIDEQLIILSKITNTRNEALDLLAKRLRSSLTMLNTDDKEFETFFNLSEKVSSFTSKIDKDFAIIQKLQNELTLEIDKSPLVYGKHEYKESMDNDDSLSNYENDEDDEL